MVTRQLAALCMALELIACGSGSGSGEDGQDGATLDELGAAQVAETCAELDEAMRNDDEALEGLCRVYAADKGVRASAPNVIPESAISTCETSLPTCPRQTVRSVCIDAYLASDCDATLPDLIDCAERIRELYRAHASETCADAVGDLLGTRTPPMSPQSTVCKRVFACFHPVPLCPTDGGSPAMIFDADELHVDAGDIVSCP